jgi:streptogramin lyase
LGCRAGGKVTLVAEGLVSAVGLAVNRKGDLFVSQLFAGQIAKIAKGLEHGQAVAGPEAAR